MAEISSKQAIEFDQNESPVRTCQVLGIKNPSSSEWNINRIAISAILALIEEGDIPAAIARISNVTLSAIAANSAGVAMAGLDDGSYSGMPWNGSVAAGTVSKWALVYPDADGNIAVSDNTTADGAGRAFFIAVESGAEGNEITLIKEGAARDDTWEWTPQATLYLSTEGEITETAPTDSGATVQPVGIAITSTTIYVDIDGIHGWGVAA